MNVKKEAKNNYFAKFGSKLALSFSFLIIVLFALASILLNPIIFLFLFPLLITPALYATQLMNLGLNTNLPLENKYFFQFFKRAYSPPNRGLYGSLRAFFKAVLIFFLAIVIISIIGSQIIIRIDPDFIVVLEELSSLSQTAMLEEIMLIIESHQSFYYFSLIASLLSTFAFMLAFLHFLGYGAISVYLTASIKIYNGKYINRMSLILIKLIKREYNKEYYLALWHGPLLLLLGFVIGFFATFFITDNISYVLLASIAGGLILVIFYLPYYFDVLEQLFKKHESFFLQEITKTPQGFPSPPLQDEKQPDEDSDE